MRSLVVLAALIVGATGAAAQTITPATKPVPVREGFYIGFGLGSGVVSYHGDFSTVDPQGALSGHIRLGGTIDQHWRIGGETNGWYKDAYGVIDQFSVVLATATFYPSRTGNLFLKGGVGFGAYSESDSFNDLKADGTAITLGLGYDFRFSGTFGLSLVGNYVGTSGWGVDLNGDAIGMDLDPSLYQLGLGVIWH